MNELLKSKYGPIFVGFRTANPDELGDEWENHTPQPQAPSNYKDPAKIDDYIQKELIKLQANCGRMPLTGRVEAVSALDGQRRVLIDAEGPDFYQWLTRRISQSWKEQMEDSERAGFGPDPLVVFGLEARAMIHLCAIGAARSLKDDSDFGSWGLFVGPSAYTSGANNMVRIYDPLHVVMGKDGNRDSKIIAMANFISDERNDPEFCPPDYGSTRSLAEFSLSIVETFGLASELL